MIRDQDEISIKLTGGWHNELCHKLREATFSALRLQHKLPDSVRLMSGMSGKKYRYLINNLIESLDDARYLEIGSWKGSTACAAMHGNKCKVTCIDDWSHHGTNNQDFFNNTKASLSDNIDFTVIEKDFRQVDYSNIGKYNVYFFDGPHDNQCLDIETEFFVKRAPVGAVFVFDDIWMYDHDKIVEEKLFAHGFETHEKKQIKASYIKVK